MVARSGFRSLPRGKKPVNTALFTKAVAENITPSELVRRIISAWARGRVERKTRAGGC